MHAGLKRPSQGATMFEITSKHRLLPPSPQTMALRMLHMMSTLPMRVCIHTTYILHATRYMLHATRYMHTYIDVTC